MYVVAFALAAIGWLGWSRPLNRAALGLVLVTFVIHTIALVSRIYISGRPPVTNLYSAAIFIGWGGVLLGIDARSLVLTSARHRQHHRRRRSVSRRC